MNILGVGPGELILILLIALVVVGPERLPDFARQTGRLLVRFRNWFRGSPDAAIVLRMRQELEQELSTLRSSLLEVQNVRDEVLDVAKQINESINEDVLGQARESINDLRNIPGSITQQRDTNGRAASAAAQPGAAVEPDTAAEAVDSPDAVEPDTAVSAEAPEQAPASVPEMEQIGLRIQAVMSDLWALQEELKQRGLLAADWQPPSFGMSLPGDATGPATAEPPVVAAALVEEPPAGEAANVAVDAAAPEADAAVSDTLSETTAAEDTHASVSEAAVEREEAPAAQAAPGGDATAVRKDEEAPGDPAAVPPDPTLTAPVTMEHDKGAGAEEEATADPAADTAAPSSVRTAEGYDVDD